MSQQLQNFQCWTAYTLGAKSTTQMSGEKPPPSQEEHALLETSKTMRKRSSLLVSLTVPAPSLPSQPSSTVAAQSWVFPFSSVNCHTFSTVWSVHRRMSYFHQGECHEVSHIHFSCILSSSSVSSPRPLSILTLIPDTISMVREPLVLPSGVIARVHHHAQGFPILSNTCFSISKSASRSPILDSVFAHRSSP